MPEDEEAIRGIIREQAVMHIEEDYKDVPWLSAPFEKSRYRSIGFWKRVRGF